MDEQGSISSEHLEALLTNLRRCLESETSIGVPELMTFDRDSGVRPPEQEGVEATVKIRNNAPVSWEGGEVVFTGVGLRIWDNRQRHSDRVRWVSGIKPDRPSDRRDLREGRYGRGTWVGGLEKFIAVTSNEESFGQVLFPGEVVVYKMRIPKADLAYTSIQVEGSVSRRHLFHFVQPVQELEQWARPLLIETFRGMNAIDVHGPSLAASRAMSGLGPETTLADLQSRRTALEEATEQAVSTTEELNKLFNSAPRDELRAHMKEVLGRYLNSVKQNCAKGVEALSSGDMEQMAAVADALKTEVPSTEEVDRKTLELMSRYGITADEAGFRS